MFPWKDVLQVEHARYGLYRGGERSRASSWPVPVEGEGVLGLGVPLTGEAMGGLYLVRCSSLSFQQHRHLLYRRE